MTQKVSEPNTNKPSNSSTKRPNETGTINVEGFVKIFDPKTKEIFVEKRA
jgi:hypothetical protein